MTRSSSKRSNRTPSASRSSGRKPANGKTDAISLLKADHREVEKWFGQFEKTDSLGKKQELAQKICTALRAHTTIEEEIFYPAFLEATDEKDMHHEAEVEHDGAKKLITEIEGAGPDNDHFDAKVTVLSEMIKHHVMEEEQRGGMFAKARQSDMDLKALGEEMHQRKDELMAGKRAAGTRPPASRPRGMAAAARSR